jgi:hypothetical protein
MDRKKFPTTGIYAVIGGICDVYYLTERDSRRYRYITPAEYATPQCWMADCWIVDKNGNINPGTDNSPVPFALDQIGRRIA